MKSFVAVAACLIATAAQAGEALPRIDQRFAVEDVAEMPSFQRHVLPLMGRLGCNGRACHGSFQGQGGLRLSLFGYDFKADYEALTTGDHPRIDKANPDSSLILAKPTLVAPHKGGKRMEADGWEYRVFLRWIESGAAAVEENGVRFERLEVAPQQITFAHKGQTVPLRVIAHWSDGSSEDVTPLCRFRSNNESVSEIDATGLAKAAGPGDTDLVAFYDNGVATVQTLLPVSQQTGPQYPDVHTPTPIDVHVVQKLRTLGIVPSDLSDDAEFLRRASLDMTGTLPTPAEIEAFLADNSPDKRRAKIDELLERPAHAAWWATRFCDLTGNNPQVFEERGAGPELAKEWYLWVYERLRKNVPYDELVSGLVLATSRKSGQDYDSYRAEMNACVRSTDADLVSHETMPLYWARTNFRNANDKALGFAYSFLGVKMQCAECHKHPFDQWTQEDFKEFANFFGRVQYGTAPDARERFKELQAAAGAKNKKLAKMAGAIDEYPWREVFIATGPIDGMEKGKNKKKRQRPTIARTAKLLGGDDVDLTTHADPREILMAWLRDRENPYFAKAFVNRVWAAYFGTGIIEPVDDLNLANPPSNPALLDYLADGFVAHGYDMKWVHREIANSRTYQLSWKSNDTNRLDVRNFSHAVPRRLPAEVLYDAIRQAVASSEDAATTSADPQGRAIAQGNVFAGKRNQGKINNYALNVFGKPARTENCDCERSSEPSLLQTIYLRNDAEMLATIEQSAWLRQVAPRNKPATPVAQANAGGNGNPKNITRQVENVKAKISQFRKAGNDEKVKQLETRLVRLERQLEQQGNAAAEPAPEKPQPATAELTGHDSQALIREAYLRTLSRPPTADELAQCQEYFTAAASQSEGLRDVVWALLNTKEFVVNH